MYGVLAVCPDKSLAGFYLFLDSGRMVRAVVHPNKPGEIKVIYKKVTPNPGTQGYGPLFEYLLERGFVETEPWRVKTFGLVPLTRTGDVHY